jgi:hypothetical protein
VTSQPWNRRHREYTEMLKSGSPIKVAKVLHRASPSPPRPRRNNRARPRSHPQLKKGDSPLFLGVNCSRGPRGCFADKGGTVPVSVRLSRRGRIGQSVGRAR